jgi:hypothetical protein
MNISAAEIKKRKKMRKCRGEKQIGGFIVGIFFFFSRRFKLCEFLKKNFFSSSNEIQIFKNEIIEQNNVFKTPISEESF